MESRFLIITGEKLSCDVSAVDPFVRKFQERIEELVLGQSRYITHKNFCPPS
jgi:hypothetical protein